MKTFIIAEVGVNHNGSVKIAEELIDAAVLSGADAVKFQAFSSGDMATKFAPKADYQKEIIDSDESQLDMLKKLEFTADIYENLMAYCARKGIVFLSSAFDLKSLDLLINLGLKIIKVPSGEITNLPYLKKIGGLGKKIILSTGMSYLEEVKNAIKVLVSSGTEKDKITVLHCNTEYPTPVEDVNLRAMLTIKDCFGVRVGYSDHTMGIDISLVAVALGAEVIEKHITLDHKLPGPDHSSSLNPDEFKVMVENIRKIEVALGDGIKKPSPSDKKQRDIVRKSIIANTKISKGEVFTDKNITVKRPGCGINPMKWNKVIGKVAKKEFKEDEFIEI